MKGSITFLPARSRTICQKAGVGLQTIHDIRCSCITNWAKQLSIHAVKQLAGYSGIETTRKSYPPDERQVCLSVQPEDVSKTRAVQASMLGKIPIIDLTAPKLTGSVQKEGFRVVASVSRKHNPLINQEL